LFRRNFSVFYEMRVRSGQGTQIEDDANWMKRQPGYVSTQLRRRIG
jgi:hypothetical protein